MKCKYSKAHLWAEVSLGPAHLGRNFNFFFFAASRTTPGFTDVRTRWVWEHLLHGTEPWAVARSLQDRRCSALNTFCTVLYDSTVLLHNESDSLWTFCHILLRVNLFLVSKDLLQNDMHTRALTTRPPYEGVSEVMWTRSYHYTPLFVHGRSIMSLLTFCVDTHKSCHP